MKKAASLQSRQFWLQVEWPHRQNFGLIPIIPGYCWGFVAAKLLGVPANFRKAAAGSVPRMAGRVVGDLEK